MYIVEILALLVGASIGVLIALLIDGQFWSRRLRSALDEKEATARRQQETAVQLRRASQTAASAKQRAAALERSLQQTEAQNESLAAEREQFAQQVSAADAELAVAHGNLTRVTEHSDGLQAELDLKQEAWETALADVEMLREEVDALKAAREALVNETNLLDSELAMQEAEHRHLQEKAAALQGQVDSLLRQLTDTQSLRKQVDTAVAALRLAEERVETLQEQLRGMESQLGVTGKSQLQIVNGIGPAYARRLQEAGISTLADLAQQEPAQVAEIVKLKPWQNAAPQNWIAEARQLTSALQNGDRER